MTDRIVTSSRPGLIYSTAKFAQSKLVATEFISSPASEVHAKETGTTSTVCGQSAMSWFKFWDRPFEHVQRDRCSLCIDVLRKRRSSRTWGSL